MRSSLIALALAALAAPALAQETAPPEAATSAPAAAPTNPVCRVALDSLKPDILYGLRAVDGAPVALMGPAWVRANLDAKGGAARIISCFLMQSTSRNPCAEFDLVHWQSGKVMGRYEGCRLKMTQ